MQGDLILSARVRGRIGAGILRALSCRARDRRPGEALSAPGSRHRSLSQRHPRSVLL